MDGIIRNSILFIYNAPITFHHYVIPLILLIFRWGNRISYGSFIVLIESLPYKFFYTPVTLTAFAVPLLNTLPEYPDDCIPTNTLIAGLQIINSVIVKVIVHQYCQLVPEHCYYGRVVRAASESGAMQMVRGLIQAMVFFNLAFFLWYAHGVRRTVAVAARAAARWLWKHAHSLLADVMLMLLAREYRLELPVVFLLILHNLLKAIIEEYLIFAMREVHLFVNEDLGIEMMMHERVVVGIRFRLVEPGQRRLVVVAMNDN